MISDSFVTSCPTGILCPWDFPDKNTGVGCHCLHPGDLPHPGIKPVSFVLAGRFFTTEPPGKPQGKTVFSFVVKTPELLAYCFFMPPQLLYWVVMNLFTDKPET